MELKIRKHQQLKMRDELKSDGLLMVANGAPASAKNWLTVSQRIETSKLNCYKINNKAGRAAISQSVYQKMPQLISGAVFILSFKNNKGPVNVRIFNSIDPFSPIFFKLNNKNYTLEQVINVKFINFKTKISELNRFLKSHTRHIM